MPSLRSATTAFVRTSPAASSSPITSRAAAATQNLSGTATHPPTSLPASTTASFNLSSPSKQHIRIVIGASGVLGGAVIIGIVLAIAYILCRRRARGAQDKEVELSRKTTWCGWKARVGEARNGWRTLGENSRATKHGDNTQVGVGTGTQTPHRPPTPPCDVHYPDQGGREQPRVQVPHHGLCLSRSSFGSIATRSDAHSISTLGVVDGLCFPTIPPVPSMALTILGQRYSQSSTNSRSTFSSRYSGGPSDSRECLTGDRQGGDLDIRGMEGSHQGPAGGSSMGGTTRPLRVVKKQATADQGQGCADFLRVDTVATTSDRRTRCISIGTSFLEMVTPVEDRTLEEAQRVATSPTFNASEQGYVADVNPAATPAAATVWRSSSIIKRRNSVASPTTRPTQSTTSSFCHSPSTHTSHSIPFPTSQQSPASPQPPETETAVPSDNFTRRPSRRQRPRTRRPLPLVNEVVGRGAGLDSMNEVVLEDDPPPMYRRTLLLSETCLDRGD